MSMTQSLVSHIVSEVVAASIDQLVARKLGKTPARYRHVDDFFLCFESQSKATTALLAIRDALREFELEINPAKTFILPVEDLREESWVEGLRQLELDDDDGKRQRRDLHRYFAFALNAAHHGEDAVKYAVRRSGST